MLTEVSQRLNLTIAAIAALFCLCPLLSLRNPKYGQLFTDDGGLYREVINTLLDRSPSLLAPLFVVLIPVADQLLDMPQLVSSYLHPELKPIACAKSTVVVRLNDAEKLLFMLGMCLQSAVWFLPAQASISMLGLVYFSTTNASILIVMAPILTFLQRCTTTFTTFRATAITVTATVGVMTFTISNFLRYNNLAFRVLDWLAWLLTGLAGIIFVALITACAFKYCYIKLATPADRQALLRLFTNQKDEANKIKTDISIDNDSELYANYIPALHMISMFVIIVSGLYVGLVPHEYQRMAYDRKNYIVLCAEILILVVELRIRKNEITRGLIALLESKKSYVRYISHELRTPLNTAFLGLKLLSGDLKASNDPKDVERYETLCDVNMSCTAAVDILNDLLCYEKLESGILELHKEEIVVEAYLKDRISMFSAQARECGVTITMITNSDIEANRGDGNTLSTSLLPTDSIFADKFKMDQVIRNLMSNALKFTPRGGVVTVKALFVHDRSKFDNEFSKRSVKSRSISFRNLIRNPSSVANYPNYPAPSPIPIPVCGTLVVVMTDTGAGISRENQKRLFTEIVQFNPEKLQAGGGSGLGLWITQEILNLHDGSIRVSSEGEGKGSSFTFEMPMIRSPPLSLQLQLQTTPRPKSSPCHSPGRKVYITEEEQSPVTQTSVRLCSEPSAPVSFVDPADFFTCPSDVSPIFEVLVVDDSRLCRKMLQKCLRADGHTCFEAEDGLEAIAMVKERIGHATGSLGKPFDAVLMDFVMPNMDGPTATKKIRALGYTAPIFGVTGNGLPTDVAHYLNCGADRVLLKPLDISAFGQAMRDLSDSVAGTSTKSSLAEG